MVIACVDVKIGSGIIVSTGSERRFSTVVAMQVAAGMTLWRSICCATKTARIRRKPSAIRRSMLIHRRKSPARVDSFTPVTRQRQGERPIAAQRPGLALVLLASDLLSPSVVPPMADGRSSWPASEGKLT